MTANVLIPALPRLCNNQTATPYLLLPSPQDYTQEIVLSPGPHSGPPVADRNSGHLIPFPAREPLPERTVPAHCFLPDVDYEFRESAGHGASEYTHLKDPTDTYDRDGMLNSSPLVKGAYVDLYL